jgi:Flp pilus assembly protein TadD
VLKGFHYAQRALIISVLVGLTACATGPGKTPERAAVQPVHSPEQAREWAIKGVNAHENGDIPGAIKAWQTSVALDPSDATTVNNLALLLKQQNRFRDAANLLEQGVEAAPEVAQLHYNLAVISELYLLDLDKALVHYQRYRALTGEEDKLVAGWIADLERRLQ